MPDNLEISKKQKVCFVDPYCYPLFNAQCRTMFGGWEVRIALIAKELAKRGNYKISIIVADHGQPHIEFREGVELISWKGKAFWGIPSPVSTLLETPITNKETQVVSAQRSLSHPSGRLKNRAKKIYKRIIPWRVRIVVTGLLAGWKDALRSFREAAIVFRDNLRRPLGIARRAAGHMADEPVFPEMVELYEEAGADIYVVPGNSQISAEVAWFCRQHKREYIMLAGSDIDFSSEIKADPDGVDLYGSRYSLKQFAIENAKVHIVQNAHQAEMARTFGCSPILIPNPVDLKLNYLKTASPNKILWVGNTEEKVKRPSAMLEVIRQIPDCQFVMIVTQVTQESFDQLTVRAQSLANLSLLSHIPFEEVEKYFSQAKVFVNTSIFEGFPNTFLQAGKYGVPIVSLKVDPNEMISRHGCGLLCDDDIHKLKQNILELMSDTVLYDNLSSQVSEYVRHYHDKETVIPQYEAIFQSVLTGRQPPNRE